MKPRLVEVRRRVLAKNDRLAAELRARFRAAGTYVVNLMSGPGAGKTTLLAETLRRLPPDLRAAVVVGDLATDNDARRLAATGAAVRQVNTGSICHLEAEMVGRAVAGWDLAALDLLFIENVGNLVCPAAYDLGEDLRVVLFSVAEGEDKPAKYPTMVIAADLVLLTKVDLASGLGFDRRAFEAHLRRVRPDVPLLEVSARDGTGLAQWVDYLTAALSAKGRAVADGDVEG